MKQKKSLFYIFLLFLLFFISFVNILGDEESNKMDQYLNFGGNLRLWGLDLFYLPDPVLFISIGFGYETFSYPIIIPDKETDPYYDALSIDLRFGKFNPYSQKIFQFFTLAAINYQHYFIENNDTINYLTNTGSEFLKFSLTAGIIIRLTANQELESLIDSQDEEEFNSSNIYDIFNVLNFRYNISFQINYYNYDFNFNKSNLYYKIYSASEITLPISFIFIRNFVGGIYCEYLIGDEIPFYALNSIGIIKGFSLINKRAAIGGFIRGFDDSEYPGKLKFILVSELRTNFLNLISLGLGIPLLDIGLIIFFDFGLSDKLTGNIDLANLKDYYLASAGIGINFNVLMVIPLIIYYAYRFNDSASRIIFSLGYSI